jgi:hypothetical protein
MITTRDHTWSDDDERTAAALWRSENPNMSVFDCDAAMKERYRARIRERKAARAIDQ